MPAPLVVYQGVKLARQVTQDRRVRWAALATAVGGLAVLFLAAAVALPLMAIQPPDVTGAAKKAPLPIVTGGPVAGIPAVSYAALILASQGSLAVAGCHVSVPVLGGVMGIESGYGTFGGSQPDPVTGLVTPPIYGPALDGRPGFELIYNDDYGRSLGVVGVFAKAVGPTQFLPNTWLALGRDGSGDGVADPQNIYDAAMSTAAYLCAHGYVEGDDAKTRLAIFRYNPSFTYVALVLERAAFLATVLTTAPPPGPLPGLTTVGGITVASEIAGPLAALLAAAEVDGLHLGGYGYRTYQDQVDLRRKNCPAGYDIFNGSSEGCRPPTARPGYSNHEKGLAIDFNSNGVSLSGGGRAFQWLAAHAATYGFHNLPSEPWHWSTTGA